MGRGGGGAGWGWGGGWDAAGSGLAWGWVFVQVKVDSDYTTIRIHPLLHWEGVRIAWKLSMPHLAKRWQASLNKKVVNWGR